MIGASDSTDEILLACGVSDSTLSPDEREALDREGYVVMTDVVDDEWLERLRAAFERGCKKTAGTSVIKESGTRHLSGLVNLDRAFEVVYTNPRVLVAIHHVLRGPFRLGQMSGRDPLPGYGQQGLHADWTARLKDEPFRVVTAIWLLDDFTADNGATRLVPGTHLFLNQPPKSLADPGSHHPDERTIIARAGSVLLFNGHIWHSGTRNGTSRPRRVLQCSFVAREECRFGRVKVDAPDRLSAVARYILACDAQV